MKKLFTFFCLVLIDNHYATDTIHGQLSYNFMYLSFALLNPLVMSEMPHVIPF